MEVSGRQFSSVVVLDRLGDLKNLLAKIQRNEKRRLQEAGMWIKIHRLIRMRGC